MTGFVSRLVRAFENYRNPLRMWLARTFGSRAIRVVDRRTGLTFLCRRGADQMMGETFHRKVYDVPMAQVRSADVVLDVGGNHGFTACYFAWRGAKVYAFEPDPRVLDSLKGNVTANGLDDRVQSFQWAVASEDGEVSFYRTDAMGGGQSSTSKSFVEKAGIKVQEVLQVEAHTVRYIFNTLGLERVRLLKLDCEGGELAILKSLGQEEISRIDSLAVEFHPRAYDVEELMDVILRWNRFHVSLAGTPGFAFGVLHAVSEQCLRDWAGK